MKLKYLDPIQVFLMYVCKTMPRRYLGFGHERLNPEKVSENTKLFMRAKTSVDKNPSNAVTEVLNLAQARPFKLLISVAMLLQQR